MGLSYSFAIPVLVGMLIGAFSPALVRNLKQKVPKPVLFGEVVMFGDSITQQAWNVGGTGAALANAWQRKFDVLNRGLSGYNTAWAIPIAKMWFPHASKSGKTPAIKLMTIWFGANDAAVASPQGLSISEFKANLHTIIKFLTNPKSPYYSPSTKFLLITPPPVDAAMRNGELASRIPARVPDRDSERTRLFAEAVKEVGLESGVTSVDVWTAIMTAATENDGGLGKYLSDGLHLTADGYAVVTAEVTKAIATYLPELHWDNLEQTFPHWASIINEGTLGEEYRVIDEKLTV